MTIPTVTPASARPRGDDLDAVLADPAPSARDVFLEGVELRPGVTADIHLRILSNPRGAPSRKAIVAVHGASSTASSMIALGETLLASPDDGDSGERAYRYVAVDLPGHGESPPPVGALFGELSLADYSAALLGTLDRLKSRGVEATTLIGHSMGGAVVLLSQQSLVSRGSSFKDAYGVEHVVGLAPAAWPQGVPCAIAQDPQFGASLTPFQTVSPVLGPVLVVPSEGYLGLAWSRPDGSIAPEAPPTAEIAARGWASPESLTAVGGLVGAPAPLDAGIFRSDLGTRLDVVSFQHDTLVRPSENEALYQHVTGASPERGWTRIDGPNAVHGLPISNPAAMLAAVEGRVELR
jgi:pimeloyl-ACP methyl ester carboxylesterase